MPLQMQVFTGSDMTGATDLWHAAATQAGTNERVNASEQPGSIVDAVNSPSLFGSVRIIAADLDGITEAEIDALIVAAPGSDAVVVARITELPAARRKRFEKIATITAVAVPQAKDLPSRVDNLARQAGIRFGADARRMLIERSGDDIDRIRSVIEQCRIGHLNEPTIRQLQVLLGTSERGALPWDVSDAIERNDLQNAVDIALQCEPIPLVAYLANRYLDAARVRESSPLPDAETAAAVTGQARWQAERTAKLASRINSEGFGLRLRALAEADRLLKTDRDPAAVIGALVNTLIV
jgi:DNA polymerase III delta subunit